MELFNRGSTAVSLAGWSVQYASATGAGPWQVTPLTGSTLAPGQRYLVRQAGNANGVNTLPSHDASGSIAMGATAGKVALVRNAAALSGACPTAASVVDLVGYGATASCSETSPTPAPGTTRAAVRSGDGCADTNNNAADFTSAAPDPRNSASAPLPCAPAQAKAGEPLFTFERAPPPFGSLSLRSDFGFYLNELCEAFLPAALSARRPRAGSTRWRRDVWASGPRGTRAARPRPPAAWP